MARATIKPFRGCHKGKAKAKYLAAPPKGFFVKILFDKKLLAE